MRHLEDRVIAVTGAGRGIGRAYAEFLASQGAKLVVNDTGGNLSGDGTEPLAAEAVESIVAAGGKAVADTHDVSTEGDGVIATAIESYGRIDGLVNNAGIVIFKQIDVISQEEIDRMLGVHLHGSLNTCRAAWPHMRQQGHGRIVNISSVSVFGVGAAPLYPTAKAAIIGLTRALAVDGAPHNIKVNGVMPIGYSRMADTQATFAEFSKKHTPPELVAPFVGSLLVDDAPCTGEMFAVAGGRAARVFMGTVPGLVGFRSIDDCLNRFDEAMDMHGLIVPDSMEAEIAFEFEHLGIDFSALQSQMTEIGTSAPEQP